ncbi:uncharacterized protein LOC131598185 [Vicia villosa]|uniref:uncharacterized protein LOC131598178 n=1 Tax=Vicia villosa TaxID=3911 RepID=UPI00273A8162|nr:uncharacterized protein LOC131598178 [Vicia villosa]XP_058726788.1 uncharacterized protein LOC131598179 [Vicia villosa]XP_058726789.1 uncharacterized protein LOC131598180 [Vicia villosa]XP_058726791.1 uncharacterized protein LOC131598184 [Vicia villosa]XP_058726792.1 uncharacterized protein LOC131598185 [Vicia villosa]
MGGWVNGVWQWGDFGISGSIEGNNGFDTNILSLRGCLAEFDGWKEGKDEVVWRGNPEKVFSVASFYAFYENLRIPFGPSNRHEEAFGILWKMEVPFKIKAFGWRLLHNRLPMKDLLERRGMSFPLNELKCTFCEYGVESRNHYFFDCWVVKYIWREIASWVGKEDNVEEECLSSFMEWHSYFYRKKAHGRKLNVVWMAITWILWSVRNGWCFRKEPWNVNNIVWNIKILVWKWSFCGKITYPNYSFYEFCMDPIYFLS